ncbi:unnamed protein product [Leptosia nina]|uniref:HAUS augmin-like complex subunit 6 N-terminal domain-containing protein n=1 Tax=Leptosia nina TaxID=320188 RepID=A0AAV1IXV4_9NEOP
MSKPPLQQEIPAIYYRKETFLSLGMLSNYCPMSTELSRLIFKENALEKPTQIFFNQLSYYLITIIDAQAASKLTWPLLDSKAERTYRNDLHTFISSNTSKGLTPVMSPYLVRPSCYKVTILIFQMTSLALSTIIAQIANESQKQVAKNLNEAYKQDTSTDTYITFVENEIQSFQSKLTIHKVTIQHAEVIAKKLREQIIKLEDKNHQAVSFQKQAISESTKVDELDEYCKESLISIRNTDVQSLVFDDWLLYTDNKIDDMVDQWDKRIELWNLCKKTANLTKDVVLRYTGQVEKTTYSISYNPETDKICTKDLELQVDVEQAYVLKNIDIDGNLSFPNLVRGFLISSNYITKNVTFDDYVYKCNKYLETGMIKLDDIYHGLQNVNERILKAKEKLQYNPSVMVPSKRGPSKIYPGSLFGPSLSNLKAGRDYQAFFDTFTPLAATKHRLNLYKNTKIFKQPSITIQPVRDDFMKSLVSYNGNTNYEMGVSSNLSAITQVRSNETIADCASGFTRQQIQRLLSTKKTSSSKKYKYNAERPEKIKPGALTYDSGVSIESNGLTRSYSSPNLLENREKRSLPKLRGRKLSIMKEDSPLELSGISALENNSNFSTPGQANAESSRKISTPEILISNASDSNTAIGEQRKSIENLTPKTNPHLIRKTSSIEKIINRFKKVRASVIPPKEDLIEEFKENVFLSVNNRLMLPDLVSPNVSDMSGNSSDCERRPRQSLGSVLGVDQTILDQFDLID